jgi:glutathione-independent formaldehyde dehydrogenase
MNAILHDKVQIARAVNATVIPLEGASEGYKEFDQGAAKSLCLTRMITA